MNKNHRESPPPPTPSVPPLASTASFQCLAVLLGMTLISCFFLPLFLKDAAPTSPPLQLLSFGGEDAFSVNMTDGSLGISGGDTSNDIASNNTRIPIHPLSDQEIDEALLLPPLQQGLDYEDGERSPNMMYIVARIYRFLEALAESNQNLSQNQDINLNQAADIHATYTALVTEHLVPLDHDNPHDSSHDETESRMPQFSTRSDDSIYLSIAAYREHLLADTLQSAFQYATNPDKIYAGVIVQNCNKNCKNGRGEASPPDINGIETFCALTNYAKYCNNGQIRPLYINETESLGPAVARYYASKLYAGETYFCQVDAHLKFARGWDELYIEDLKLSSNYPRSILSSYPPGFVNFMQEPPYKPSNRLCRCRFSKGEGNIVRIEMEGKSKANLTRPTQMAFIGAGFLFARGELVKEIKYDPYLPWCFMGEEIAFSMRAWTSGWDIYAPRLNLIGHHYRPVSFLF